MLTSDNEIRLQVEGMDCANCALALERGIAQLEGVDHVQVNFTTATLEARGSFELEDVVGRVEALGYRVAETPVENGPVQAHRPDLGGVPGFVRYLLANRQTRVALIAALFLLLSAPLSFVALPIAHWSRLALQGGVVVLAGYPIARKGVRSLLVARQITIDLLMSIATLGALLIGETGEAATVILLFAIGEALEGYTAERARHSLRELLALKPDQANVLRPCMDCEEHLGQGGYAGGACPFCGAHPVWVPVEQVGVGERVLVRPGERIPVDGQVAEGTSLVDQAPVTGESVLVTKAPGDEIYAGTLNGDGALEVTVTRPAGDSTISRIVRLVEQAQMQRAPVERFVDRFATWYTPGVVALAAALALLPPLLLGAPFFDLPDGTRGWLYRALALLIVACPCALVISTPVTVVSALISLARRGVLVKGGAFLDALARVRVFAFDKTGTLTRGQPVVTGSHTLDCPPDQARCLACDDMLAMAAAVESRSDHPLAQAILAEVQTRRIAHSYPSAEGVQAIAGQGVQGTLNGSTIIVGRHTMFHDGPYQRCDEIHDHVQSAEANGETVMLVSKDDVVVGYVSVADVPRPSSREALRALKAIDPELRTVMLTGDNLTVAYKVADSVGLVDEVRAGLLPEDKLGAVESLREGYGPVAMVGDGVNDAPALAAATVGIAMGGAGSAQAMETADVVLMQDDLTHLPEVVRASRRTQGIIRQNIAFSLAIKAAFLLLTLPGWATLWMAVFADMGASLLVTLNGMRMLRAERGE